MENQKFEFSFFIKVTRQMMVLLFDESYSEEELKEEIEGIYYSWCHPAGEDPEMQDEIENSTPEGFIFDQLADHGYHVVEYRLENQAQRERKKCS